MDISEKDNEKPPNGRNGKKLPKSVALIYSDVKREYFPTKEQYLTEKDAFFDAKVIAGYLRRMKIRTILCPANDCLAENLKKQKINVAINLVGSIRGKEYLASTIPGVLELLRIPYTGAGILGESLAYNKFLVKKLLEQNGVPVPHYQLLNTHYDPLDPTLRFPLISKLNEIHGAVEITKDAVSENEKHLRNRVKFLIKTYNQPVLVEEFIVGREITAYLLEGLNKKVYLAEKIFKKKKGKYIFSNFQMQWGKEDGFHYRKYNDPLLKEYVKKAFDITRMDDYGKFDVRLDSSGRYFFLDCNSNPAFGPKQIAAAMGYILELYGISFTEVLKRLLLNTLRDATGRKPLPFPGNGEN